jgi:hypothetical protein
MNQDQASITYTISGKRTNGDSFSLTKIQSLSKSVQGANGSDGAAGPPGAGVVYRGEYDPIETYYYSTERRDIVKGTSGTYFLANNATDSGTTNWDDPDSGTDWTTFGAQFSSVATDILFSQDVYAERTINIGASGSNPVIALNADHPTNANPFISIGQTVQGYNNDGIFLGYDGGVGKLSVDSGSIGGWNISSDNINATDGTGTTYLYSDGKLALSDSGSNERVLVTQTELSSSDFTATYDEPTLASFNNVALSTAFTYSSYVMLSGGTPARSSTTEESDSWYTSEKNFNVLIGYAAYTGNGTTALIHQWGTPGTDSGTVSQFYGTTYFEYKMTVSLESSTDNVNWTGLGGVKTKTIDIDFVYWNNLSGDTQNHPGIPAGTISFAFSDTVNTGARYYRVRVTRTFKITANATVILTGATFPTNVSSADTSTYFNHPTIIPAPTPTINILVSTEAKTEIGSNGVKISNGDGVAKLGSIAGSKTINYPDASSDIFDLIFSLTGNADIAGTLFVGNLQALSDGKLKTNVSSISNPLISIDRLNPVSFDWKDVLISNNLIKSAYGFIAQEVEPILPDIVSTQNNDIVGELKNIDYNSITAINTSAIKELLNKIRDLEKRIEELEG